MSPSPSRLRRRTIGLVLALLLPMTLAGIAATDADRSKYEGDCVYCWVDGSEPGMPVWSEDDAGFTHQAEDRREQVVLDETFGVDRGEERSFRDKIIWIRPSQRGDMEVYGTLVFENCLLLWDQTEHQQTRLRVKNGGTLRATSTYAFSHNGFWVNWEYENGATVRFERFVGDPWTSIWGHVEYEAVDRSTVKMTIQNSTRDSVVRVVDAHHVWFEIFPPLGRYVEIAFAPRRQWSDWTIDDMWPGTVVSVEDSYVYERDISLGPGNHVTVRDTTDGFSIGWIVYKNTPGFVRCELSGLGDPDAEGGTYYEHHTWELYCMDSSLTLINSRLDRAWPTTWGNVHLTVRDSKLADPRVWDGPATYAIYDSTVDHAAAYNEGRMYLGNCLVRYDIEVKDAGSKVYAFGLRTGDVPFDVIEVDGGEFILLDDPGQPW